MWYIEQVEKSELEIVAQIIRRAYLSQIERLKITKENWPDYIAFKTGDILEKEAHENKDFYLLYEDQEAVGTVCIDHSLSAFNKGYVQGLAVLKEARENGWGTKLMEYAENALFERGAECVEISIVKEDHDMEAFAVNRGYEVTHEVSAGRLPYDIAYLQLRRKEFKIRHKKK